MGVGERLKSAGTFGLVIASVLFLFLLAALYMRGLVWLSEKASPWLAIGCAIGVVACVFLFLPLSIFRKTRSWGALGLYFTSYLFGAMLFAFSCLVVLQIWCYVGLFIGLLLAGIGVVPVAFLAALFHAEWTLVFSVVGGAVLTYGTRYLGIRIGESIPEGEDQIVQADYGD